MLANITLLGHVGSCYWCTNPLSLIILSSRTVYKKYTDTLDSRIIGPPRLLIFWFFSHQEILIPTPLVINFSYCSHCLSMFSYFIYTFSNQEILIPTPPLIKFQYVFRPTRLFRPPHLFGSREYVLVYMHICEITVQGIISSYILHRKHVEAKIVRWAFFHRTICW